MKSCQPVNHEQHLCRLYESNLHKSDPGRYANLVKDPQFVCKSCGRVAADKQNLCEPVVLGTWEE
jgi:hypothetical protein